MYVDFTRISAEPIISNVIVVVAVLVEVVIVVEVVVVIVVVVVNLQHELATAPTAHIQRTTLESCVTLGRSATVTTVGLPSVHLS